MSRNRASSIRGALAVLAGFAIFAVAASPVLSADSLTNVRGYVDKSVFLELANEEDVTIEIWLPASLLRIPCAFDPDLAEFCRGLELVQAVVMEIGGGVPAKLRDAVAETERSLIKRGWVRMAKIREGDGQVSVLVLNDDDAILGLTVLVMDAEEGDLVFANVAGQLDLSKIQQLGEQLDLPGLKDIEVE